MISNYKYKPLLYFFVTFIATYTLWFTGAYVSFQDDSEKYMLFMLAGLLMPFIISLIMIWTSKNSDLKKDFVNRIINLRLIKPKMLPVYILIMPLAVVVSIILSLPFGESISQFQIGEGFSFSSGFVPVLFLLILAASFEELGWRGYAFDSLHSRYNFFTASIIFAVLWSLWHFPLVFVNNSYQYEIFHENIWFGINFFMSIIPMGIIVGWIWIKNGKSIIAAILFHLIINLSAEMLQITQITKCIETVVLTVFVIAIIAMDKELFFSKEHLTP